MSIRLKMVSRAGLHSRRNGGFSLIELIVTIVILSIATYGLLTALNLTNQHSVDPIFEKQALAVAESLMDEVLSQPYTYCDPTDANAQSAQSAIINPVVGCATLVEGMGPEAGQTRYSAATPFNNVNDYDGFYMATIRDLTNTTVAALSTYSATVRVYNEDLWFPRIPAASALHVVVTVDGPSNTRVRLDGFRTLYSPRTP